MRIKMKRFLGILLSFVLALGMMPGMSLTAYAASSGKNGGFNWTLDDDGKMTVTGSGALPESFIDDNGDIKSIVFDENCQVSGLAKNSIYWANNATEIIINSTADLTIAGSAIWYSSSGGAPVFITINAPKVTIAGSKPFFAYYNRQLNITVNTNELIVYNGTMSYLGQYNSNNSFAYPANSTVYIPAGYVFTDSHMQEQYDKMVQRGGEEMFWQDYGQMLKEGRDYTYNAEASSVALTSENAGTVFGGAQTSSSNAYTAAHTHSFTYKANGETITATCSAGDCNLTDNTVTLTIVKPTLETYGETGKSAEATLEGLEAFNAATGKAIAATAIRYVGRDGTTYAESQTAPTDEGKYTAKITVEEVTASVNYEIVKANAVPHKHDIKHVEAKEPTCTEDGYEAHYECTICYECYADDTGSVPLDKNEIMKKATGHKWDDGVITQEATYDETGIKTYTCSVCGETKAETIPVKTGRSSSSSDSSDSDSDSSGGGSSGKSGSISTKSIDVNGNVFGGPSTGHQPDSGMPLSDRGGNWGSMANNWSYTKSDGTLAKNEWLNLEYNGHTYWYFFDGNSTMQTDWLNYNGATYYFVPDMDGWRGRMATGWHQIGEKWYYFEPTAGAYQGVMYRGAVTPDGHIVGADGAWNGVGTTPESSAQTGTTASGN